MASSGVPAVPWTINVESPLIAAERCSETQVLAVPGTPSSSSARSVARVATATSISRREPMYFGVTGVPSAATPPSRYGTTAPGDSPQPGGGRGEAGRDPQRGQLAEPGKAPAAGPVVELVGDGGEDGVGDGRRPRRGAQREHLFDADRGGADESTLQDRGGLRGEIPLGQ